MGCGSPATKKTTIEPDAHVSAPVAVPQSPPGQVQPVMKLNLFTVSEEMSGVDDSERPKRASDLNAV